MTGVLLVAGVDYTWLLSIPVVIVVILGAVLTRHKTFKAVYGWILHNKLYAALFSIALVVACSQGFIQILYGVKTKPLDETGGIAPINSLLFAVLALASIMSAYNTPKKSVKVVLVLLSFGSAGLAGLVYYYQYITAGLPTYYSTKLGYIAFLLLFIDAGAYFICMTNKYIVNKIGALHAGYFVSALVVFIPLLTNLNLSSINYVLGKRNLSEYSASQTAQLMIAHKIDRGNFIMYKKLNYNEDLITTHFVQLFSNSYTVCEQGIQYDLLTANESSMLSRIKYCASNGVPYYIISSSITHAGLKKYYKKYHNIHVLLSN